jgi:hypothetical protein
MAEAEKQSTASARIIGAAFRAAGAALSRISFLISAIDSLVEVNRITHCRQSTFLLKLLLRSKAGQKVKSTGDGLTV